MYQFDKVSVSLYLFETSRKRPSLSNMADKLKMELVSWIPPGTQNCVKCQEPSCSRQI